MADDHKPFPRHIQNSALVRQGFRCASCGEAISTVGRAGRDTHIFGEGVEGHHVIPHSKGGPLSLENCVILCRSCHISAHQGGAWKDLGPYKDLRGTMAEKIATIAALYPHYTERRLTRSEVHKG